MKTNFIQNTILLSSRKFRLHMHYIYIKISFPTTRVLYNNLLYANDKKFQSKCALTIVNKLHTEKKRRQLFSVRLQLEWHINTNMCSLNFRL